MFVHLHVHSFSSPNWGIHSPEALCAAAVKMGCRTLALTDRNGFYAIPRFLDAARDAGISPIIGSEAVTAENRALLLARDEEGYANISRLISDLHCKKGFDLIRALDEFRRGVIVISDDRPLLASLKRTSEGDRQLRSHSPWLFVELSPGHNLHRALALSRELKLPPVATSRALFLTPEDLHLHRVIRAIHLNAKLSRLPQEATACDSDFLFTPERMAEFFPHCPEAIENSRVIAGLCKSDWDFSRLVFPAFRQFDDRGAFQELSRRAREGAIWRYGKINSTVEERLDKELTLIRDKGFSHYFLVVEEISKQSERTCGRGSAAASLVAFALGITHVDPIRHNLFFERFLNEGRMDPPDIDIDFPWDERDQILDFAFARYGAKRAAMVANQVGFKGRGALREVAKVYGLTETEIKQMTQRISGFWKSDQTAGAVSSHPLFQGESLTPEWQEIMATAQRLNGHLRHLSLHCGGLIIVPDEIRKYVPVEISAKGLPLIQWEKDQAEDSGLVKIDILGNRSLAVVRDAMAAVKKNRGIEIDYASWRPLEDEKTCTQLRRGATMGCFYLESPSIRLLLRKIWGDDPPPATRGLDVFEILVQSSSIIRPAANTFILEYLARLHGKKWTHLHPLLEPVLGETYGIAIYQEQITQIAMELAGFSAFDGDQLRKVITKKHKEKRLADYRRLFISGGKTRGVPEKVLEAVWEQILSFAGYSFCKPHSASYAHLSAKAAYLKANFPAEFMAAVVSNQGGYYSPFAYLSECKRMGLTVLSPDINESGYHYSGKGEEVRVGLMQIDGLTQDAAQKVLKCCTEGGHYRSFADFLRRTELNRSDVERLIRGGCFDTLDGRERRPALLWELLHFQHQSSALLFEQKTELPAPPPYDEATVLRQETESLGFLVSRHPITLYRTACLRHKPIRAARMFEYAGKWVTMVGWWITTKTVDDKFGRPMEFVSFEDTTAIFDTTFFPEVYARFCRKLSQRRPYVIKGAVEVEFGVPTLRVKWIDFLDV